MKTDRIITSFQYPPIPIRTHDWCAYRENDVEDSSRYGWGRTEEAAIHDLKAMEEEREDDEFDARLKSRLDMLPTV